MKIIEGGTRPTRRAPAEYFTGIVWQDPIIESPPPARLFSSYVSFAPGARTHWHTHPFGQTLYIVSGVGRVQSDGGPVCEVHAGDVVWFDAGEKHWHGAAPATGMVHVAMQEARDGKYVDWLEPVTDGQYGVEAAS